MQFLQKMLCLLFAFNFVLLYTDVKAQKVGGVIGGSVMLGPFNSQPVEPFNQSKLFKPVSQVYSRSPFGSFSGVQSYYKSKSNFSASVQLNTVYWPEIKTSFGSCYLQQYTYSFSAGYVFFNKKLFTIEASGVGGGGNVFADFNNQQNVVVTLENGKLISPGFNETMKTPATNFGASVQIHKYFCKVPKKLQDKPLSTFIDMGLKFGWLRTIPAQRDFYSNTNLYYISFIIGGGVLELTN